MEKCKMFHHLKCFWSPPSYQLKCSWGFSVFDLFTCMFILCWFHLIQPYLVSFDNAMCNWYQCLTNIKKFCVYHFCFVHSLFHQRNQLVWFHLISAFYKYGTNLSLHFLQVVSILIALALLIVLVICQVLKLNLVGYNSFFLNPQLFSSFKL